MRENLDDPGFGNDFLDAPKLRYMKWIIDKLDFIKIKFFLPGKRKNIKQAIDWENISKDVI
jgi:hypothetical protein